MAFFDPRIWGPCLLIELFIGLCVLGVVREFSMLEILGITVVLGIVSLLAAIKFTARPTDLSGNE